MVTMIIALQRNSVSQLGTYVTSHMGSDHTVLPATRHK